MLVKKDDTDTKTSWIRSINLENFKEKEAFFLNLKNEDVDERVEHNLKILEDTKVLDFKVFLLTADTKASNVVLFHGG